MTVKYPLLTSDIATLKRAIEGWMRYRELCGDHRFYTPDEWKAKGESMCADAVLTLVTEGPLYRVIDGITKECDDLREELNDLLTKHGYWYELGFSWSLHFYSTPF